MSHPPYDCENCGITHFSYSAHVEFANRERSKKVSMFAIIFTVILVAVVGYVIMSVSYEDQKQKNFSQLLQDFDNEDLNSVKEWKFYDKGDYYSVCEVNPSGYSGCLMLSKPAIIWNPKYSGSLQSNESVSGVTKP